MPNQAGKLRVAIIGGGIGGLACAVALKNADLEINLYEAASQIAEVGAGISIWPRTWDAMREMDLEDDLIQSVQNKPTDEKTLAMEYHKGKHPDCPVLFRLYLKGAMLSFHRHELQQCILKNIPESCHIHLHHRLQSYTETEDGVKLSFQNGEVAECDILIGADGLKSVVRSGIPNHFRQGSTDPLWTGRTVYRALIPAEKLREVNPSHRSLTAPVFYIGKNRSMLTYPIRHDTVVNFLAFYFDPSKEGTTLSEPETRDATKEEVIELFVGWGNDVQSLANLVEKPLRWAIQALQPLDTYVSNSVALLGDAAHAMPPFLYGGAGSAIEDAYILGKVITHLNCTQERIPILLKRYDEIRQPMGNNVLLGSLRQSRFMEENLPGHEGDAELSEEQYKLLAGQIEAGMSLTRDDRALIEAEERAMHLND